MNEEPGQPEAEEPHVDITMEDIAKHMTPEQMAFLVQGAQQHLAPTEPAEDAEEVRFATGDDDDDDEPDYYVGA